MAALPKTMKPRRRMVRRTVDVAVLAAEDLG